jgi:hypothetical protein
MLCQLPDITARFKLNSSNSVPGPGVLTEKDPIISVNSLKSLSHKHLRAPRAPKSLILKGLRLGCYQQPISALSSHEESR